MKGMSYSHAQKPAIGGGTSKGQPTSSNYRGGASAPKGPGGRGSMKAHK